VRVWACCAGGLSFPAGWCWRRGGGTSCQLAGADSSVPRLARSAWHSDIALMRGHTTGTVCTDCWAYRLLTALEAIGALPRDSMHQGPDEVAQTPPSYKTHTRSRHRR
jgi:hypothetical protein